MEDSGASCESKEPESGFPGKIIRFNEGIRSEAKPLQRSEDELASVTRW